jgi:DNA repair exonuclease SbcCD nuclease subunit
VTRFIHTADWQLGMTRHFLTAEAQARFDEARTKAVGTIGELAVEHGASFVVVGGDVFETNQVARPVVVRALEQIRQFPEVTFYLLPGNHDPLDPSSVFTSPTFVDRCPDNVVVLTDSSPIDTGHGCEVLGAPWLSKRPGRDLVAEATHDLAADGTVRVVVGHGAVDTMSPDPDNPALISLATLDEGLDSGKFHYVALGDRHSFTNVGDSGRVLYSGAPEPTDFRELDPGKVLLVDLDDSDVSVTPLDTGTWRFVTESFSLAGPADCRAVQTFLDELDNKSVTIVKLALTGQLSITASAELEATLEHYRDLLAALTMSSSRSDLVVLPDDDDLADLDLRGFGRDALEELLTAAQQPGDTSVTARDALGLLYRLQRGVS